MIVLNLSFQRVRKPPYIPSRKQGLIHQPMVNRAILTDMGLEEWPEGQSEDEL